MEMLKMFWVLALAAVVAAVQNATDSAKLTKLSTVIVHLSLAPNAMKTSPTNAASSSSIMTSFTPSGAILSSGSSASTNTTNTTMDPGASCNAAFISWTSEFEYTVTANSTQLFTSLTYWTEFPKGNDSFTLCDGWPRAHGEPFTYSSTTTSTRSGPMAITKTSEQVTPKPSCTIGNSACSSLWSSYSKNYGDDPWAPEPACEEPSTTCDPQTTFWTASDHPACLFDADPVRLVYFPVSVKGDRLCGTNYTTVTSNHTTPKTIEALGTTFTSGTAYISFENLQASDRCGNPVGTGMKNFFLPLPSSEVSSRCGEYGYVQFGPTSVPLNFADLNTPIALSVYSCMARCEFGVHNHWQELCPTIYDDYAPALAYPTDHIRKLQPEWANCGFDEMLLRSDILYDPPLALSEVTSEAAPTLPAQTAHVSTALPPPTPTPTAVTSAVPVDSGTGLGDPGPDDGDDNDTNGEDGGSDQNDPSTGIASATAADPATNGSPQPTAASPTQDNDGTSDTDDSQDQDDPNANNGVPATTAQNVSPTSAAAIGDAIASVIGLIPSTQSSDDNDDQSSDASSEGDANGASVNPAVSTNNDGNLQVGSQVVQPGSAITTNGVTVSAVPDGSAVVVNGATVGSDEAVAAVSSAIADSGGTESSGNQQADESGNSGSLDGLVAAIASAAAGNGNLDSDQLGQEAYITAAGQVLPLETNSAGEVLIDGHTLAADGSGVTINGQTYSVGDNVVYQGRAPVATLDAAVPGSPATADLPLTTNAAGSLVLDGTTLSNGGSPVTVDGRTYSMSGDILYQDTEAVATQGSPATLDVPLTTNAAGSLVLDGTTFSSGGSPVTINGKTYSVSGSVIYQNNEAVATVAGAGNDDALTIDGRTVPVSTNPQGAVVVDGKTMSSGSGPVTIDGMLFSVLGSVLYQGSHPVTTMSSRATSSTTRSAQTTRMTSSAGGTRISSAPASATSTGDASRPSVRSFLTLMSLTVVAGIMVRL